VVPVAAGAFQLVMGIPPGVYPVPVTSPVALYAVVVALIVAEAKYKAALNVSAVVAARMGAVPKLWVPVSNWVLKEVHIA
jgi:hypothetical protein